MEEKVVPVVEETPTLGKDRRITGAVRVEKTVHEEHRRVAAELASDEVQVQRHPVDRFVDEPVPDRREGDTLVISVTEEVLVIEKRLKVVEEIHVTRRAGRRTVVEDVPVRREEVEVKREPR